MALSFNDVLRLANEPPGPDSAFTTIAVSGVSGTPTDILATAIASPPTQPGELNLGQIVRVVLKAPYTNTKKVYISNSSVETNTGDKDTGYPLAAGDSLELAMNPSQVSPGGQTKYYAVGDDGAQKLAVIAVVPAR